MSSEGHLARRRRRRQWPCSWGYQFDCCLGLTSSSRPRHAAAAAAAAEYVTVTRQTSSAMFHVRAINCSMAQNVFFQLQNAPKCV